LSPSSSAWWIVSTTISRNPNSRAPVSAISWRRSSEVRARNDCERRRMRQTVWREQFITVATWMVEWPSARSWATRRQSTCRAGQRATTSASSVRRASASAPAIASANLSRFRRPMPASCREIFGL
jgi:hypothetical protein